MAERAQGDRRKQGISGLLALVLLAALFVALAWGYLASEPISAGLASQVDGALADSGVESRVTAVLLNYRAYDTLLECFVLLLGVVAVWSMPPVPSLHDDVAPDAILISLVRQLVPLMLLVGGYLLWAGSNQAGGAFQAGAVLGGAGVLLLLTSSPLLALLSHRLLAFALCLGPAFFVFIAMATLVLGGDFLGYRRGAATLIIVALEALAAFSIGVALAALFGGRRFHGQPGPRAGSLGGVEEQ